MDKPLTSHTKCEKCGASFAIPQIQPDIRTEISTLVKQAHPAMATKVLRDRTGLDLRDCKGVILHITRSKGICHRCGGQLHPAGQSICPKCKSLNLDW